MYGKLVVFLCAAALASAGYSGPPNYGYNPAVSSVSYKSQETFGPVASNSGTKAYNGPTVSPVPGAFLATTKNGNPVSTPTYPPVQYSTTKSNEISYSYANPTAAAYPTQYAGVTDYPASYSSQNYAQYPQSYSQAYPQTQAYQAYPSYSQGYQQAIPQAYAYPSQVAVSGYQAYPAPSQYQAYSAPSHYQGYQAPTQYQAYPAAQYSGYPSGYPVQYASAPAQYSATPVQYSATPVQYSATPVQYSATPVQYSATPVQYSATPVQYSATPVQYSSAPAVSHVQYSGSDGSYSWKKK